MHREEFAALNSFVHLILGKVRQIDCGALIVDTLNVIAVPDFYIPIL